MEGGPRDRGSADAAGAGPGACPDSLPELARQCRARATNAEGNQVERLGVACSNLFELQFRVGVRRSSTTAVAVSGPVFRILAGVGLRALQLHPTLSITSLRCHVYPP